MKKFIWLGLALVSVLVACNSYQLPAITIQNELSVSDQQAFLALVNNKRQNAATANVNCLAGGANFPAKNFTVNSQALVLDTSLTKAGLAHINHMVRIYPNGFTQPGNPDALAFDPHNKAGDGTPVDRATATGFSGSGWGEVMAFDFASSSDVLSKWLTSSFGHCQVVMDNDFNRAGFAKVTVPNSSKTYWIMAVGRNP